MLSNLNIYLAIAEEAFAESQRLDVTARPPKSNGEPGHVIAYDPDRKSFKQSLVAIAFAGMYFDALLYLVGTKRLGKAGYQKIDRKIRYEEKLRLLGVTDAGVLAACGQFREARNDLTHEKAVELHEIGTAQFRKAQQEAAVAVAFIKSVTGLLHAP